MSRSPLSRPVLVLVLSLCLALPAVAADTVNAPTAESVREAAEQIYFHGITAEMAEQQVGADGVVHLLDLLADPEFERRDNVVAYLAWLGAGETSDALVSYLSTPPSEVTRPEEERALMLAPQALGHIAGRGEPRALEALLEMTRPGGEGSMLASAATAGWYSESMCHELIGMAIRGLALSGRPEATERLSALSQQRVMPVSQASDQGPALRSAMSMVRERTEAAKLKASRGFRGGRLPVRRTMPRPRFEASTLDLNLDNDLDVTDPQDPVVPFADDSQSRSHDTGLTYSNHVDISNPLDNDRLDAILEDASYRAATEDFTEDVGCCIRLSRQGNANSFGTAGDGLNTIDDSSELNTVLSNNSGRVKVVTAINYCGGPGMNIIGCASTPGSRIAVVRWSTVTIESILWIHEYGHNTGLGHHPDNRHIMFASNNGSNNGLSQTECDAFHVPSGATQANPVDIGVCQDDDNDDIASSMDNCPNDANANQQDSDGDGVGDVCEGTTITDVLESISTRGRTLTDEEVVIAGLIVTDGTADVLLRALGPSLSSVSGALADPVIELYQGQSLVTSNDDWQNAPNATNIQNTGLAPSNPAESAIFRNLTAGSYTVIVRGAGDTTGVVEIEAHQISGSGRLRNLSTRGPVTSGTDMLTTDFVIDGSSPKTVIIRALGPTLGTFGVPGALADPSLTLRSGGSTLATNDNWGASADSTEISDTGFAPPNAAEAAILVDLAPGSYTAVLDGAANGVALLEVYEVLPSTSSGPVPPPMLIGSTGDAGRSVDRPRTPFTRQATRQR
ncbi:hypothetical protein ABI59_23285 [Acidobacteria bacterium Mor1]|nr:hypothetical protein ABI59_23285 [Acidobacteria bacterium Mor1]